MTGQPCRAPLGDHGARFAQGVAEKGDQNLAARIQRLQRKAGPGGLQPQRRIGKAEIEALVAARHRGARRQHHTAAAIEQIDQIIQPIGTAAELLHRPRDLEAAMGAIFAMGRKRESRPVHVILLRNLPRERHTGQTKRPSHCDGGLRRWEKMESHRPPLEGGPPETALADEGAHEPRRHHRPRTMSRLCPWWDGMSGKG